jgi:AraC-like DNA-binding protein
MRPLTLPALIHFSCAALGLLLAVLLLVNRTGNRAANRWLAAFILSLALMWTGDFLDETRLTLRWPWTAHTTDWLTFFIGPCLWIYVRVLTGRPRQRIWALCLHCLLAAACLALLGPFYVLPAATKVTIITAELRELPLIVNWPLLIAAAQIIAYWGASLLLLHRLRAALREHYSFLGERSFDWLRDLLSVTLAMWIVWVIGLVLHSNWSHWVASVVVPPGLYLLAFFGLRQRAVYSADREPEVPRERGSRRYERSGLDREKAPEYLLRLDNVMRLEKPWLEADLTLGDLAKRAGLTPHNLSQLLNEELGQSFFDYINRNRVEEVKRCLLDPAYASQTILDIALAAGFSSKTAFNSAFRQHTGVTPSHFRRQVRIQPGVQSG